MWLAPLIRRRLPICCHRSDLPGAGTGVATSSHDGSHVYQRASQARILSGHNNLCTITADSGVFLSNYQCDFAVVSTQ
jgi:hypothetical protein